MPWIFFLTVNDSLFQKHCLAKALCHLKGSQGRLQVTVNGYCQEFTEIVTLTMKTLRNNDDYYYY